MKMEIILLSEIVEWIQTVKFKSIGRKGKGKGKVVPVLN
jgi:hypothetical protein